MIWFVAVKFFSTFKGCYNDRLNATLINTFYVRKTRFYKIRLNGFEIQGGGE